MTSASSSIQSKASWKKEQAQTTRSIIRRSSAQTPFFTAVSRQAKLSQLNNPLASTKILGASKIYVHEK